MLCPYVQGTQIGLLSSDSTWGSVFTHRAPRPCCVTDDRVYLADIAATRYTHRLPSDAPGQCLPAARAGNAL